MPDMIRHPVSATWFPAFAGKTIMAYLVAGLIMMTEKKGSNLPYRHARFEYINAQK